MQYFRLEMECGGLFQTCCVDEVDGNPYVADYIGKEMPADCCAGSHKVVKQERISHLTGDRAKGWHPPKTEGA